MRVKTIKTKKTYLSWMSQQTTIHEFFIQNNISLLIHGHTHRPNTHQISEPNVDGVRIVLGDWHDTGWCLTLEDARKSIRGI